MIENTLIINDLRKDKTKCIELGDSVFCTLRITGTGIAYRDNEGFVYREPNNYLTEDFLKSCIGLPIIAKHPPKGVLSLESYENQSVGSILEAYIEDDCVLGIARLFCKKEELIGLSTSPTVIVNSTVKTIDNIDVSVEDVPLFIDHVALCENGVWDKLDSENKGLYLNIENKGNDMTENEAELAAKAAKQDETTDVVSVKDFNDLADMVKTLVAKLDVKPDECKADEDVKNEDADKVVKEDSDELDALRLKLEALQTLVEASKPVSLTEDDYKDISETQAKADSVYAMLCKDTPRPVNGVDTRDSYLTRVIKGLQSASKAYAKVDMQVFDYDTKKNVIFPAVVADAIDSAKLVANGKKGVAIPYTTNENGRISKVYMGSDASVMTSVGRHPSFSISTIGNI